MRYVCLSISDKVAIRHKEYTSVVLEGPWSVYKACNL